MLYALVWPPPSDMVACFACFCLLPESLPGALLLCQQGNEEEAAMHLDLSLECGLVVAQAQHLSPQLASAELSLEQQLDLNADFWLCVDGGEYTFQESKKALEPRFDAFSRMLGSVFRCVQAFE